MGKTEDAGKDAELDAKDRKILSELDMDARQLRRDLSERLIYNLKLDYYNSELG